MSPLMLRFWLVLALFAAALLPAAVQAQEQNRAGLVVMHGDGRVVQQCVVFAEESISGYELLKRAGPPLSVEAGAFGATVCSIDGEGCSYPSESCFCRCQGSPCVYWSYWRQQPEGTWRYQALGAGNTKVRNGDVEGWRWAEGTTRSAEEPPLVTFDDLCMSEEQTVPAMAADASEPAAVPETEQKTPPTKQPAAAAMTTVAGNAPPAVGESEAVTGALGGLWLVLIGVMVVPAAVLAVWALLRCRL